MNRPAQRELQKFQNPNGLQDIDVARAFEKMAKCSFGENNALWWALWISYCWIRRELHFSVFRAFETLYNDFDFMTDGGKKLEITKTS